ncbi:hypothetical protein [Carnobacterium maltaromaticum]|uniref:hypothetical protein n=1 Tax=Carnobacterium maltaromaticum TaxID=2751 RepID=UPI0039AFB003
MVDEKWIDLICYSISFIDLTIKDKKFERIIAVPLEFQTDKLSEFFLRHFEDKNLVVLNIQEVTDAWLSRDAYPNHLEVP